MRIIAVESGRLQLHGLSRKIKKVAPGAEIKGFCLPADALSYALENTVDVAFLDMEPVGMHGLILAKKLKEINNKTNIVFISAETSCYYAQEAFRMNASGYLLKPVREEQLANEMSNLRYSVRDPCVL